MPTQAIRTCASCAPGQTLENDNRLDRFYGWYDLVVKVNEDPTFEAPPRGSC